MWFDPAVVETFRDAFPEWFAFVFAFLSYLGSVWFVAPTVVLAFWFWDRHRFASWLAIVVGGYAIMVGFKGVFSTPRPGVGPAIAPETLPLVLAVLYAPAVEITTTSFPSGHAIAAVVIWTMLALEVDRGTHRQRLLGGAAMVVLVSVSRVGVGVHYPIDLVVGAAIGIVYVALALEFRRRLRMRDRRIATDATFTVSAALGLLAFAVTGHPDAAALLGGSLGALLVWRFATPPREPWPVTPSILLRAAVGISLLGLVALVLIVFDSALIWFVVGFVGGGLVVGLPSVVGGHTSDLDRTLASG